LGGLGKRCFRPPTHPDDHIHPVKGLAGWQGWDRRQDEIIGRDVFKQAAVHIIEMMVRRGVGIIKHLTGFDDHLANQTLLR